MTPERWKQIDALFHQAADLPPTERAAWLAQACGADTALHAEVSGLLASDNSAPGFVQQEIQGAIAEFHAARANAPLRRIGPYRLVRELGRGGMGTVYLAERADEQYQGEVAIKLVRPGMDTDFFLARFRRERQTLARLQHPNIARLMDSGTTDDGLPYIVMERIDGQPITAHCREHRLGIDAVLRLFLPVCAAVSYAHRSFVVHRDLKPGNILVDTTGTPKLLDFGICKLLLAEPSMDPTQTGAAMMTPDYASPEQVRGDAITVASDIYSLGAVLYELLTAARPHVISKYTPREVERAICEQEVTLPSTAAKDRAAARLLHGDLDNILLKALHKEPDRRYVSVEQFAGDLRRYLAHLPVSARPDTLGYRARKFVRRNRGPLAAGIALAAVLGAGIVASAHEASLARHNFAQARKLAGALIFDVHDRVRDLPGSLPAREAIVRAGLGYLDSMAGAARSDSTLRLELAAAYERMGTIQGNVFGSYTGDTTGAMASFRKGLAVLQSLSSSQPVELERMALLRRIGNLLRYSGHLHESYQRFEEAVRIGSPLHELSPQDEHVTKSLAELYDDYAGAQREGMLQAQGIENESKAVDLLKGLLAAHPGDRSLRAALAETLSGLGALQSSFNQLEAAKKNYQDAASDWDELCRANPTNMDYQRHRMLVYGHIGDLLANPNYANLGDQAGGVAAYGIMLAIARQLYEGNPADQGATTDYGMALARAAVLPGQKPEAQIDLFRKGVLVLGEASARDPSNTMVLVNLASVHEQLGDLLAAKGKPVEARDEYHASLKIAESNLDAMLSSQRIFITVARQLALDAARRDDAAAALNYGNRAVAVGDRSASARNATVPARVLAPRAYAAMGDIYETLRKPDEARHWRERALAALQETEHLPGFTSYHQQIMQRVEEALNRK